MVRIPLKQDENLQLNNRQYTIDKVIGRGATCIVYSAYYKDSINHRHYVNIKECYPHNVGITRKGQMLCWKSLEEKSQHISEFHKAYDKVMLCQNGNYTVHAFDIFENNNTGYIIMDANEGATFDKSPVNSVVEVLKTVKLLAHAVGNYHNNGYLHLDIKPSNFLVYPQPSEHIVLFDMDTVTSFQNITSGSVKYIPYSDNWAAPEQKQGKISKLCAATDIYAIGAILFEKIMGRSIEADDMSVFADWEFEGEKFDKLNPKIKRLLHTIFHKTLSANIKRRYQSCDELIVALDEAISVSSVKTFIVPSYIQSKNFIGRKEDLKEINALLKTNSNVFIHGFAGTGKTEFAREYAIQNKKEFDTIVFCRYNGSLISSLQRIPVANFEDYKENFKFEFEKLCNDDRLLIILDNFDVDADSEQDDLEYFLNLNCKKIITTRTNFSRRNDAEIYHLECLAFDDAVELFKFHSKIHEFSNEDILEIKEIFARVAYNTLFICRLAKEISSRGLTISKLAINVMTDLLKNVGKAEVYKDGKVSNTTIYDLAKILFKLDELSSDQLQVMRNLYMLRWRTVNLAQYREIACFNMDEVTEDRTIDTLLYLESRGYFENSQSDASNREIYLHSIVAELIDKDYETTVCDCIEIAKYYQSQIKNVLSNNDKSVYAQYKQQAYIELIFEFYKSLNINYKSNVEYIIDSIYVSCVKTFKSNSNMVPFVHEVFYDKIFTESVNPSDETINMKLANVHIWFTLESICSGYFGDCLNVWEEPAFDAIAAMHNYCLSNPNDKNINFFVEEVILFSQYLKSLYQSGRLKELLGFSTWTFNEEAFLKIQEYIDSLSNYMTPKQKKICEVYFSHNLKQIIKAVKVLPEIVVRESQENSNSSFRTYARATFRKQKNILPTIMEDNNLSLNRKIELVKLYYSRCVDSFHGFMHFGERWNSELEDKKNKYNFLKDFLSNYGDSLDESNDCLNYIRWMFACLSLNYNIEEFHENMKIIMKQLKEISNQKVYSLKDFLNIWTPFEPPYDLFECETINPKLISEHILPYIKYYLSFCESLLDSKGINKNEWYGSVCINLKNYAQQHGSVFLTLFKEYEAKYHNCLGIDYTLTKNQ